MRSRHSELKAGLFVLVCFILFWVVLFSISDLRTLFVPKRTYIIAFNQVGGLERNSSVRYAGYEVGRVMNVSFAEPPYSGEKRKRVPELPAATPGQLAPVRAAENVFVTIQLRSDIQLTDLDQAFINTTLTGSVALDILPGTAEPEQTPVLINEDYVLDGESYVSMGQLVNRANDVVERARRVMPAVNDAVVNLTDTMKEAKSTVQKVNTAIDENRPRLDQAMKDAAEATSNVKTVTADLKPKLTEVLDKVKQAANDAAETLAAVKPKAVASAENMEKASIDIRQISSDLRGTVAQNRSRIDQMLENFRDASARLNIGIEDIRRNPWKLLDRNINADPRTQNVYDAALAFSDAARSLAGASSDLRALTQSGTASPEAVQKASEELSKLVENLSLMEKELYRLYKQSPGP